MVLEVVLLTLAAFAAGGALILALRFRGLVSVHQLGEIEGSLQALRQVVVVADHIEPPSDELRCAVEKNFKRGVKYLFLVSHSKAASEVHGYVELFRAIARIVQARDGVRSQLSDLIDINQLPYDWDDVPYIFYELGPGTSRADSAWIAYEGTDKKNGIADFYAEVPARDARRLAKTVLAGAPVPIRIASSQVTEPGKVIPIERAHRQAQAS